MLAGSHEKMLESESGSGSARYPAHSLVYNSSAEQYMVHEILLSAASSNCSVCARILADFADADFANLFENNTYARVTPTYVYYGD